MYSSGVEQWYFFQHNRESTFWNPYDTDTDLAQKALELEKEITGLREKYNESIGLLHKERAAKQRTEDELKRKEKADIEALNRDAGKKFAKNKKCFFLPIPH